MSKRRLFFDNVEKWVVFAKRQGSGYVKTQGFRTSGAFRVVDWGDGTAQKTTNGPDVMHTFPNANENSVSIREDSGHVDYFYSSGLGWTEIDCTVFPVMPYNWYLIDETKLRSFKVSPTTRVIINCFFRNCDLQGAFDYRHVPNIGGNIHLINLSKITAIRFGVPTYPDTPRANINLISCTSVAGELDLSMFTEPTSITVYRLYRVTVLKLPLKTSATALTMIDMYDLLHFDLTPIKVLSGRQYWYNAFSASQLSYAPQAADAPDITEFNMASFKALTGVLDLTGLSNLRNTATLILSDIPNISGLLLPPINMAAGLLYLNDSFKVGGPITVDLSMVTGSLKQLRAYQATAIGNILFSGNMVITERYEVGAGMSYMVDFDHKLGTRVLATSILLNHSGLTQAGVNQCIDQVYTNKTAFDNTQSKIITMAGNVIPKPTGVYQVPAGYVQGGSDGAPASQQEKMYVLVNQTNADGTLKYKWTITTN